MMTVNKHCILTLSREVGGIWKRDLVEEEQMPQQVLGVSGEVGGTFLRSSATSLTAPASDAS